jgi:hypothetical protein
MACKRHKPSDNVMIINPVNYQGGMVKFSTRDKSEIWLTAKKGHLGDVISDVGKHLSCEQVRLSDLLVLFQEADLPVTIKKDISNLGTFFLRQFDKKGSRIKTLIKTDDVESIDWSNISFVLIYQIADLPWNFGFTLSYTPLPPRTKTKKRGAVYSLLKALPQSDSVIDLIYEFLGSGFDQALLAAITEFPSYVRLQDAYVKFVENKYLTSTDYWWDTPLEMLAEHDDIQVYNLDTVSVYVSFLLPTFEYAKHLPMPTLCLEDVVLWNTLIYAHFQCVFHKTPPNIACTHKKLFDPFEHGIGLHYQNQSVCFWDLETFNMSELQKAFVKYIQSLDSMEPQDYIQFSIQKHGPFLLPLYKQQLEPHKSFVPVWFRQLVTCDVPICCGDVSVLVPSCFGPYIFK